MKDSWNIWSQCTDNGQMRLNDHVVSPVYDDTVVMMFVLLVIML